MKNSSVSVIIMFGFDDITGRRTIASEKTGRFPKPTIPFIQVKPIIPFIHVKPIIPFIQVKSLM